METETTKDSEIKAVVDALAGGDNVKAQASFDQVMQMKKDAAIETHKQEFASNLFQPPESSPGHDTGITGDPAEVEEK